MGFLHLDSGGPLSIIDLLTWMQSACQRHSFTVYHKLSPVTALELLPSPPPMVLYFTS
jgi:hypothetical protein